MNPAIQKVSTSVVYKLLKLDTEYRQASTGSERSELVYLAVSLIGPLAPWWLTASALEELYNQKPSDWLKHALRVACGEFSADDLGSYFVLIVCVWPDGLRDEGPYNLVDEHALLRPAPVLPLRWVPGKQSYPGLPPSLTQLAKQVVAELGTKKQAGLDWALHAGTPVRIDAGLLDLEPDSAFLPLAASLALATYRFGGIPDPRVWSTGAWDADNGSIRPVSGIPTKVAAMIQFKARKIYVPRKNYEEAQRAALNLGCDADLIDTFERGSSLSHVIRPLLIDFRVAPDRHADINDKANHYLYLMEFDRSLAENYYDAVIAEHVIELCRKRLNEPLLKLARSSPWLVTVASHSHALPLIASKVFESQQTFLLHTADEAALNKTKRLLEANGIKCVPVEYNVDAKIQTDHSKEESNIVEQAVREAKKIFETISPPANAPILIDLTPGTKPMTIGLMQAAPTGAHLIYLSHRCDPKTNKPRPGTEQYELVPVR